MLHELLHCSPLSEMDKAAAAAERVARAAVVCLSDQVTELTAQHRMPVYFVSHGSPMTMFEPDSGPVKAWTKMGADVRERIRPKGIVFVSAHWEGERDAVLVTDQASNELLYDYYGFPPEYCACYAVSEVPCADREIVAALSFVFVRRLSSLNAQTK